jgi:hypothetical protein
VSPSLPSMRLRGSDALSKASAGLDNVPTTPQFLCIDARASSIRHAAHESSGMSGVDHPAAGPAAGYKHPRQLALVLLCEAYARDPAVKVGLEAV